MLTLYFKTGCPYAAVVFKKLEDLGITVTEKNIADEGVADELIALGGKVQSPFLVDGDTGAQMYESAMICAYLEEHYGDGEKKDAAGDEDASSSPNVCMLE